MNSNKKKIDGFNAPYIKKDISTSYIKTLARNTNLAKDKLEECCDVGILVKADNQPTS